MKYLYRIIALDNSFKSLNFYIGPFDTKITFEALSFFVHKHKNVLPELNVEEICIPDDPSFQDISSKDIIPLYSNFLFNINDTVKFSDSFSIWKVVDKNKQFNTNSYILKNINNETYTSAAEYELESI